MTKTTAKLPQSTRPGLYLVATPIGNMGDMTLRGIETLRAADLILCEDTRVTGKLLKYFEIKKPLAVYNNQSEQRDPTKILDQIRAGAVVALVSDAGTPLISDPGYGLVRAARAAGVFVTALPGANAVLTAVQISGLATDAFYFGGFLPTKSGERQRRLTALSHVAATLVFFERAERVVGLLKDIDKTFGPRDVAVARELTKLFENVIQGTVKQVILNIEQTPIKGEVVVLVGRAANTPVGANITDDTIRREIQVRMKNGQTIRMAVDEVTHLLGCPRRRVYDLAIKLR